jgi:nuclear pore complex protein Nup155
MAARQATLVDLPALQNASRVLLDQLARDAQGIPDYSDLLTACKSLKTLRASSRLMFTLLAGSHVSAAYSIFPDDIRVPYQKKRFVGIPDGLFQYYDSGY